MTRSEIESALDAHRLEVQLLNRRWWKVRRNGKTKLWKTRPDEFRIPIKYGMYGFGYITEENMSDPECWRIVE